MEFNEKLQELRRRKGLTQEKLAEDLFVSRTAVSKWESGRGYPSIDSLKGIAKYFSLSMDELLSNEDVLVIAEEDSKQKQGRFMDLVFALLDCSTAMFFFLPLFGQYVDGVLEAASLLSLTVVGSWLKAAYITLVVAMTVFGVITLALQNCSARFWVQSKSGVSVALSAAATLLFIVSRQPYAAGLIFVFLIIKGMLLLKGR